MTTLAPSVEALPYFPEIYEDELLYSVAARYHRHVGNINSAHTLHELFGRRTHRISIPLPVGLNSLAARIAPERCLDAQTLANKTTHFNYYISYRGETDVEAGLVEMGRSGGSPQFVLGTAIFTIRPPQALQFCNECTETMLKERGELWWRRAHQLPGVIVCPTHGTILRRSATTIADAKKRRLEGATQQNCNGSASPIVVCSDRSILDLLWRFSKKSAALLDPPSTLMSQSLRAQTYRDELMKIGISRNTWHTYVPRLAKIIKHEFGPALELTNEDLQGEALKRGLHALLRKKDAGRHPFLHILMEQFLSGREGTGLPFRQDKHDCINPYCTHGTSLTATLIHARLEGEKLVRVYECGCGYSFFLTLFDDGRVLKPRLRNFGPTLDPALKKLVADGAGVKDAMRATGMDRAALGVAAARLSLPVKWKLPAVVGPFVGRAEPRPLATRYRSPKERTKRVYGPLRNWTAIDASLTAKLPIAADAIAAKVPPERITRTELERQLGRLGYFDSRKAKLPRAWLLLSSLLETRGQYQVRRIIYELDQVRNRGETPMRWKVLRAACIRIVTPEAMEALSGVF